MRLHSLNPSHGRALDGLQFEIGAWLLQNCGMRVNRQLIREGVVIAFFGGAVGLFLSYFGIGVLRAGLSFNEFIADVPVRLDTNGLLFAVAVSLFSAMLSSALPRAWASLQTHSRILPRRGSTSKRKSAPSIGTNGLRKVPIGKWSRGGPGKTAGTSKLLI